MTAGCSKLPAQATFRLPLQDLARLVQAAAFNVTAALLRATQSNAKFYAPAFQGKNR